MKIYWEGICQSLYRIQAQDLLDRTDIIEERKREVEQISQNMVEVNLVFKDLAELVQDQGEMINRIDENLEKATGLTSNGVENLNVSFS